MRHSDLVITLVIAYLIAIFALPTLMNTGYLLKIPFVYLIIYIVFPLITILGMYIANLIAKKMAILWQVAKFALVGVLNTAIDFGVLNFLIFLTNYTQGTGIGLINVPSFSLAILNSYIWNRKWVFEKMGEGNFFTFVAVTTFIPPAFNLSPTVWANVAKVFATVFSMIWNFTGYKLIVFR